MEHQPINGEYVILIDRLARIETKLDQALKDTQDLQGRVSGLEKFKWVAGTSWVMSLASGAITLNSLFGK